MKVCYIWRRDEDCRRVQGRRLVAEVKDVRVQPAALRLGRNGRAGGSQSFNF